MITGIVFFNLPQGISRETLMEKYRQTAPAWSKNEDLVQKYYFFDAEKNRGGGVYIWRNRAAMERWHSEEYKGRVKALYGSEPEIHYFDTLVVVDYVAKDVAEHEPA